jgi:hypothetical protein
VWLDQDAPWTDMRWKGWENFADKWRNGMHGRQMKFLFEFPFPIAQVRAAGTVANFVDSKSRKAVVEYSLDNGTWHELAKVEYAAGVKKLIGEAAIGAADINRVWIRMRQDAGDPLARLENVVFQDLAFNFRGPEKALVAGGLKTDDDDNGEEVVPDTVVVNGLRRPDLGMVDEEEGWSFPLRRDLRQNPDQWIKGDNVATNMRWKGWPEFADQWRNGLHGTLLTYRLEFPYAIRSVVGTATVGNFADSQTRTAWLEYSLDNRDFHPLGHTEYGSGVKEFNGEAALEAKDINRVWIRLRQGARDALANSHNIVFQELSLTVSGSRQPLTTEAMLAARAEITRQRKQRLEEAQRAKHAALRAKLAPLGDRTAPRRIGVVSSMVTVFPGEPPRAEHVADELFLTAARRERESAQIVVSAGPEPLSVARVEVTDLQQIEGSATIAADHIEVRLVGYTEVERPSWRGIKRLGLWPDPLLRFRPFECPAGQTRCLWVTVHAPEDALAGVYAGAINLRSQTETIAKVPVRLRVCGFTLPAAPRMHTSYWSNFSTRYDSTNDEAILADAIRMFGAYRVSTSVAQPGDVQWYRGPDGTITAGWSRMRRRLELAATSGFRTLNVGPGTGGVHGDAAILYAPVYDRVTGAKVDPGPMPEARAKAYLTPLADWLEERGWLDRAYLQIKDEEVHQANWPKLFLPHVETLRAAEPRIALESVLGLHPAHQGWFDIASPHHYFHDAEAYRMMREGVSLHGPKNFDATVTASSTGGWGNAGFYQYQPYDGYDGCHYTKWIPRVAPTADQPQWLRFDFDQPQQIDGVRIEPFGKLGEDVAWRCEASTDGEEFQPLELTPRGKTNNVAAAAGAPTRDSSASGDSSTSGDGSYKNAWSFAGDKTGPWKSIRLVWTRGRRKFTPSETEPVQPPDPMTVGVREVEFLRNNVPLESALPRERVHPVKMMWEYQVGADYPSYGIDADPSEIRATGWQCWLRNVDGFLNYGGAQWGFLNSLERPLSEDPLVWPAHYDAGANGGAAIVYPGKTEIFPSIRLARLRDSIDDFDYLALLADRRPDHPLLKKIRRQDRAAYRHASTITTNRTAVADALEGVK